MIAEFGKMRRLGTARIVTVAVLAMILMGGMATFSGNYPQRAGAAGQELWLQGILQVVTVFSLFLPVLTAIIASRQVEIEHVGNGWILHRSAGVGVRQLLFRKVGVVGVTLLATVSGTVLGVAFLHVMRGNSASVPWWLLILLAAGSVLVSLALGAGHVWISARFENQLVGVGVGILGGFLGIFSLLLPPGFSYVTPWGYYALSSPVAMIEGNGSVSVVPSQLLAVLAFFCVALSIFTFMAHRLDRRGLQ